MIKLDIINDVINQTGLAKTKAGMAVETVFEGIKQALTRGERIRIARIRNLRGPSPQAGHRPQSKE